MRHLIQILVILTSLFLNTYTVFAQWVQLPGPPGGTVYDIAISENTVCAGVEDGVFTSTDEGMTWSNKSKSIQGTVMAVSPYLNSIAVMTSVGSFFSSDGGDSWTEQPLDHQVARSICRNGSTLYAGMDRFNWGYVLKSTDNGMTWHTVLEKGNTITAVAVHGDTVYAGGFLGELDKTTDCGATWNEIAFPSNYIGSIYLDDSLLIVGVKDFFRSTDNGISWTTINAPIQGGTIDNMTRVGSTLFASSKYGIMASHDFGKTWTVCINHLGGYTVSGCITALAGTGTIVLAGAGGGLYASSDEGKNWEFRDQGIARSIVHSFTSIGHRLLAPTEDYGLMFTDDNGMTWSRPTSDLPLYHSYYICKHKSMLFNAVGQDKVYMSSDSGITWLPRSNGLNGWSPSCIASMGDSLVLGTNNGILISTDNGLNWSQPTSGLQGKGINYIYVEGDMVIACNEWGIDRSTDRGANWSSIILPTRFPFQTISQIVRGGPYLYGSVPGYYGLYRSEDQGASWISLGLETIETFTVVAIDSIVIIGTLNYGVLISFDCGKNWYTMNNGIDVPAVFRLYIHQDYLFAAPAARGAQRFPISLLGITTVQKASILPVRIELLQNYPNPFNASTTITFSVPSKLHVILKVFDALGREVFNLVSEELYAGTYSRRWNAEGMASGIYFYRLQAGKYTEVKKMFLVR